MTALARPNSRVIWYISSAVLSIAKARAILECRLYPWKLTRTFITPPRYLRQQLDCRREQTVVSSDQSDCWFCHKCLRLADKSALFNQSLNHVPNFNVFLNERRWSHCNRPDEPTGTALWKHSYESKRFVDCWSIGNHCTILKRLYPLPIGSRQIVSIYSQVKTL